MFYAEGNAFNIFVRSQGNTQYKQYCHKQFVNQRLLGSWGPGAQVQLPALHSW